MRSRERTDGRAGPAHSHKMKGRHAMLITREVRRSVCAALAFAALSLAAVPHRATAANITAVDSGRPDLAVFLLDGQIVGGETLALEALVSKLPPNRPAAIILNSPGGS